jgi:hypothetical protein
MLHKRFKSAKIIGSDEIESEEQVLGLIAECIDALEDGIKDSEIVEAFLADIAKDHH